MCRLIDRNLNLVVGPLFYPEFGLLRIFVNFFPFLYSILFVCLCFYFLCCFVAHFTGSLVTSFVLVETICTNVVHRNDSMDLWVISVFELVIDSLLVSGRTFCFHCFSKGRDFLACSVSF